jgi:hypothetical protein
MSHLSAEQLVDAVEGTLAPVARVHLDSCPACRREAAELSELLTETARIAVPEPSPLFWNYLTARVHDAIVSEPQGKGWLPRWFDWPVLAPIAGLSLLVLALVSAMDRSIQETDTPPVVTSAAATETETIAADSAWDVLSDVVGPLDIDTAREAGIATALGTADRVALQLTAGEQEELVALLQQEVGRTGS